MVCEEDAGSHGLVFVFSWLANGLVAFDSPVLLSQTDPLSIEFPVSKH